MPMWNKQAIYISGGGFTNKGAEAMVLTVVKAIRDQLPETDIYMELTTQEVDKARDYGLIPIDDSVKISTLFSRIAKKVRRKWAQHKCSAVIDVGGYQFGDPWSERHAKNMACFVRKIMRSGKLVFFMPQAWGPFSSPKLKMIIQAIVNTATISYVRDRASMFEMESVVGKDCPKIRFAHDIAWNFEGDDLSVGRNLIKDAGLLEHKDCITICVTPNMRVYERCGGAGYDNEYIIFLRELITYICQSYGARVILMGHELRRDSLNKHDDRYLCNLLLESIGGTLPIAHIDKVLTAAEVKAVIGNCSLLFSSRYHALIAALSQGIPVVAIGWSHKYDELLTELGLIQNLISMQENKDTIYRKIDAIMEQLHELVAIVRARMTEFKRSGQKAINEVISEIEQKLLS